MTSSHLLPFSVDREGPVNAPSYFSAEPLNEDQTEFSTILFGRKLIGHRVDLKSATGHIWQCQADQQTDNDDEPRTWTKMQGEPISSFVLWKKDVAPSVDDARIKAIHGWLDIAQAIHEPIPYPSPE